jgi:hypothetical protein
MFLQEIVEETSIDKNIIIISHQKVFEFLTLWLTNKTLKLDQGGICYFKCINNTYHVEIYK